MTKEQLKNKERFAMAIANYGDAHGHKMTLLQAYGIAEYIHRCEATLSRLAEDQCNYPEYDEAKQERTEKRVQKYIKENIGCECHTQRDPRGFCIRLHLKDESTNNFFNTWDGETSGCNW